MASTPICTAKDCRNDWIDDLGPVAAYPGDIFSIGDLDAYLQAASMEEPHVVHVEIGDAIRIVVAIGGPYASVRVYTPHADTPKQAPLFPETWYAVAHQPHSNQSQAFTMADQDFTVLPFLLISPTEAIASVLYIVIHRNLPDFLVWQTNEGLTYHS